MKRRKQIKANVIDDVDEEEVVEKPAKKQKTEKKPVAIKTVQDEVVVISPSSSQEEGVITKKQKQKQRLKTEEKKPEKKEPEKKTHSKKITEEEAKTMDKFNADHFSRYYPSHFSMRQWAKILDAIEEKYKTTLYIDKTDLKHLETVWMSELEKTKQELVAHVVFSTATDKWGELDIRQEDRKFKELQELIRRIERLLTRHEMAPAVEPKVVAELNQRKRARLAQEEKERERDKKEHESLIEKDDTVQLKYFVSRYGPVDGKKEYNDWKGMKNIVSGTRQLADDTKSTRIPSMKKKKSKNDDDDILDMKLL